MRVMRKSTALSEAGSRLRSWRGHRAAGSGRLDGRRRYSANVGVGPCRALTGELMRRDQLVASSTACGVDRSRGQADLARLG